MEAAAATRKKSLRLRSFIATRHECSIPIFQARAEKIWSSDRTFPALRHLSFGCCPKQAYPIGCEDQAIRMCQRCRRRMRAQSRGKLVAGRSLDKETLRSDPPPNPMDARPVARSLQCCVICGETSATLCRPCRMFLIEASACRYSSHRSEQTASDKQIKPANLKRARRGCSA